MFGTVGSVILSSNVLLLLLWDSLYSTITLSSGETGSESDDHHDEARLKATRKSRDLREKLKKISRRKKNDPSSGAESSEEEVQKPDKPDKSKGRAEKLLEEEKSPQRKVRKISPPSREPSLGKEEERRHSRSKSKHEQRSSREDNSPTQSLRTKTRRSSRSPSLPSPQTPPHPAVPTKRKQEKDRAAAFSEEGSDAEAKRSRDGRRERGRDHRNRSPAPDVKKSKGSREEAGNGTAAMPAKEEEEDDGFHEMKDPRIREKGNKQMETPQSPIVSTKSSRSSIHGNIESELSSGEDFKVEVTDWSTNRSKTAHKQKKLWSGQE